MEARRRRFLMAPEGPGNIYAATGPGNPQTVIFLFFRVSKICFSRLSLEKLRKPEIFVIIRSILSLSVDKPYILRYILHSFLGFETIRYTGPTVILT